MSKPQVIMIAGPNGAGKTSTAMTLLPNFLQVNEFVNADEIAYGLSPFNPESMAIESGRLMLKRINNLVENKKSFAFETTGAARVHLRTLEQCRSAGYYCSLLFLYLSPVELAIQRVKLRVMQGGHDIPEKDIIRRYYRGLKTVFSNYIDVVDSVEIYDNSFGDARLTAEKSSIDSNWTIHLPETWNQIQSILYEKSI
jgi:predicted ABC-type ATPase